MFKKSNPVVIYKNRKSSALPVISLKHVKETDLKILKFRRSELKYIVAQPVSGGFQLSFDASTHEVGKECKDLGLSEAILTIQKMCLSNRWGVIILSEAGEEYGSLNVY